MCGRYKQVVAANTRWVGCAAVGCEKLFTASGEWHFSKLLVCKYAPTSHAGAIRRPYFQGEPCSQCRPRERCLFGLCVHPDDAKQLEMLMQKRAAEKTKENAYGIVPESRRILAAQSPPDGLMAMDESSDETSAVTSGKKTIEYETVPDEQFFDKYEFDDYEPEDYEVVNFELNSPDIEALNGMTDSSSSSSSSNYDDNDSSFYKNYTDGDSASYDYGEFGSNDTVTYDLDPDTSDVSNKFFLDNTELEKIFPSPSSASGIEHFNSHIIQLHGELLMNLRFLPDLDKTSALHHHD